MNTKVEGAELGRNGAIAPYRGHGMLSRSLRATLSSYLKTATATAESISTTVRSAGASMVASVASNEEEWRREEVKFACFDEIHFSPQQKHRALLLGYANGFQVWDIQDAGNVREVVSKRDGSASLLKFLPLPLVKAADSSPLAGSGPHLCIVSPQGSHRRSNAGPGLESWDVQHSTSASGCSGVGSVGKDEGGVDPMEEGSVLKVYSVSRHLYVHKMQFRSPVIAMKCNSRVLIVALSSQVHMFCASTMEMKFSALTYPAPARVPSPQASLVSSELAPVALGPRWLAYASNQSLVASTSGRISPQHFSPSPGVSPSTSPASGSVGAALMAHYARESGKHLANGIATIGDAGYKVATKYWTEFIVDDCGSEARVKGARSVPRKGARGGGFSDKSSCSAPPGLSYPDPDFAGSVIVRDVVTKGIVAHFRAHSSPIAVIEFDPSGTLLLTASICGHSLNVFRIMAAPAQSDASSAHVHLYRLYRGITSAVIRDISFSPDSQWVAVSSSRGTTHLFAISPFGGPVGPGTHAAAAGASCFGSSSSCTPSVAMLPWWASSSPLRTSPSQPLPAPAALTLSVVARIRSGTSGWAGTVTNAAASAAGLKGPNLPTIVASAFHNGGSCWHDVAGAEAGVWPLRWQLWTLTSSGHLVRYALTPHAAAGEMGLAGGGSGASGNSAGAGKEEQSYAARGQDSFGLAAVSSATPAVGAVGHELQLKLAVEPREKWDVCRKVTWVEREEPLNSLLQLDLPLTAAKEARGALPEELRRRRYMSFAEVQMLQHGPSPLWTKSNIQFHVFCQLPSEDRGSIEIEHLPTKVLETRRRDLVPLSEHHQFGGMRALPPHLEQLPAVNPGTVEWVANSTRSLRAASRSMSTASSGSNSSSSSGRGGLDGSNSMERERAAMGLVGMEVGEVQVGGNGFKSVQLKVTEFKSSEFNLAEYQAADCKDGVAASGHVLPPHSSMVRNGAASPPPLPGSQPGPSGLLQPMVGEGTSFESQDAVDDDLSDEQPSPHSQSFTPCSSFDSTASPLRKFPRRRSPQVAPGAARGGAAGSGIVMATSDELGMADFDAAGNVVNGSLLKMANGHRPGMADGMEQGTASRAVNVIVQKDQDQDSLSFVPPKIESVAMVCQGENQRNGFIRETNSSLTEGGLSSLLRGPGCESARCSENLLEPCVSGRKSSVATGSTEGVSQENGDVVKSLTEGGDSPKEVAAGSERGAVLPSLFRGERRTAPSGIPAGGSLGTAEIGVAVREAQAAMEGGGDRTEEKCRVAKTGEASSTLGEDVAPSFDGWSGEALFGLLDD